MIGSNKGRLFRGVALLICAFVALSGATFAKDKKKTSTGIGYLAKSTRREWKRHPVKESISLCGAVLASTLIHETGHALAVKMVGGDVTKFKPYPSEGNLGYCGYGGDLNDDQLAFVYISSELVQIGSLNTLLRLQKNKKFKSPKILDSFVKYWATLAYLDFPVHSVSCYWDKGSDVARFSKYSGVPREAMTGLAALQIWLYYPSLKAIWGNRPPPEPKVRIDFGDQKVMISKTWKF